MGLTPFEVMLGKPPPRFPPYSSGDIPVKVVDSILSTRKPMYALLQKRLAKAQADMKWYTDARCRNLSFMVGD